MFRGKQNFVFVADKAPRETYRLALSKKQKDTAMPGSTKTLRRDLTFTMPFSNVLHLSFADKIEATQRAGFSELTLQPQEVRRIVGQGLSIGDMKAIAADGGVRINRLDPLCTWNPNWQPKNMDDAFVADHSMPAEEFFALCNAFGCQYMSLNATFAHDRYSQQQQVDFYAGICQRAAEHGLVCDLEPIPMWGVRSLENGWDIVRQAGQANGGLVLDTLHFTRSHSSLETLAGIPGDRIHCVQICDGVLALPEGTTLEQDCFQRLWPGQGDFVLKPIISLLNDIGGLNQVGPEVFSLANAALSAEAVAAACRHSLQHFDELCEVPSKVRATF
ncbi:sugar phosphate isomerase/epimerase family protein [Phytopseudomonas dryadis]|nr:MULTISPECIES: sugar phosphate isomerase/epimerase [Pseudomonas]